MFLSLTHKWARGPVLKFKSQSELKVSEITDSELTLDLELQDSDNAGMIQMNFIHTGSM